MIYTESEVKAGLVNKQKPGTYIVICDCDSTKCDLKPHCDICLGPKSMMDGKYCPTCWDLIKRH